MSVEISAPMPGSIVEILVKVGDEVKENEDVQRAYFGEEI